MRSVKFPKQSYIGVTDNLARRLAKHNRGESYHTSKYKPWKIEVYFAFHNSSLAEKFEKYLKSGSGREFARRHFKVA